MSMSSTAEILWMAIGEDNGLSQGREGIRERQWLGAMPWPETVTRSFQIHSQLCTANSFIWQNNCFKWMFSHSPAWLSVGTQWNSATMKSSYKWTRTRENSPRNHRMCFMSFGDPEKLGVCVSVGGYACVYIYSLCILGHQGQTWLREELAQQNNTA